MPNRKDIADNVRVALRQATEEVARIAEVIKSSTPIPEDDPESWYKQVKADMEYMDNVLTGLARVSEINEEYRASVDRQ